MRSVRRDVPPPRHRGGVTRRFPRAAAFAFAAAVSGTLLPVCAFSQDVWSGIVPLPVEAPPSGLPEVEFLSALPLPPEAPEGLSGVAWLGGSGAFPDGSFAFAEDSGGRVHFAELESDRATGIPTGCVFRATAAVRGAVDLEGIAFDGATGSLWVSDENGPAVFRVATEAAPATATGTAPANWVASPEREPLPPSLSRCRPNLALEALAFDPAGGCLYTASEAALRGGPDGFSRLVSLPARRPAAGLRGDGAAAREWHVPLEEATGAALPMLPKPFTGLCGLSALPDGRLLALERTFGYEIAPGADGEAVQSLCRATISVLDVRARRGIAAGHPEAEAPEPATGPSAETVAEKRVLWRALTGDANVEGICLGPELPGGGRLLVAVSDGDVSKRGGMELRWKKLLLFFRLRALP